MFTKLDKAIVALILAAIFMLNYFFGTNISLTDEQVNGINAVIAAVTPVLVYLIPNKVV